MAGGLWTGGEDTEYFLTVLVKVPKRKKVKPPEARNNSVLYMLMYIFIYLSIYMNMIRFVDFLIAYKNTFFFPHAFYILMMLRHHSIMVKSFRVYTYEEIPDMH